MKVCSPTEQVPPAKGAMTNPVDLTQFGQWIASQQETLVKSLWQEQRQVLDELVRSLCQSLRGAPPGPSTNEGSPSMPYFRFSKLTPEDNIETY